MTETNVRYEFAAGIVSRWEWIPQYRTIAISFLPALILQGQEADIDNIYTLPKYLLIKYLLLYFTHPQA